MSEVCEIKDFLFKCLMVITTLFVLLWVQHRTVPELLSQSSKLPNVNLPQNSIFEIRKASFLAFLTVFYKETNITQNCVGTIISPQFILTAGHCTYLAEYVIVILGVDNIFDTQNRNRIPLKSKKTKTHVKYDSDTLFNDIGLIKVDEIPFSSSYVDMTNIFQIHIEQKEEEIGKYLYTFGWALPNSSDGLNDIVQQKLLSITSINNCKSSYSERKFDSKTQLCLFSKSLHDRREKVYPGDSGGPIIFYDGSVHVQIVVSILSGGAKYTDENHPVFGVKLQPYLDWIKNEIEN